MPILKIVGSIPARAWIPLATVLSPSAVVSAVALIALAVWFPMTMLTAPGVSNTRAAYREWNHAKIEITRNECGPGQSG